MITKKVNEILKKEGFLPKAVQAKLKEFERQKSGNVLDFCVEEGLAQAPALVSLLSRSYSLPVIDLAKQEIELATAKLLPQSVCFEHAIIPFYADKESIYVAMANPENGELTAYIQERTDRQVVPYLAPRSAIINTLQVVFTDTADENRKHILELIARSKNISQTPKSAAEELPIISLLNHLIIFSLRNHASDLHIEPTADDVVLRFRVDGLLHEIFRLPKNLHAPIVARIKILARLRIDEHLRPQDGRFTFSESEYSVAVRVSIVPTLHGQKAALRFLDTKNDELALESIGLEPQQLKTINQAITAPNGIILVTGPTGSGKTTTLYAILNAIKNNHINISTIEDPIEYHLTGVNQIQVNPQVGLDFSDGLRSILRQDPDVIMVGEIRDRETAQIAINAALTGHLVLSSLHTNNAASAVPRLMDMGVEPFLIASTLRAVISQRLMRVICPACKRTVQTNLISEELLRAQGGPVKTMVVAEGQGCAECLGTGYQGRTGIFEVLNINENFHELIMKRANATEIEKQAIQQGMRTLFDNGLEKVIQQITTPQEITRVIK